MWKRLFSTKNVPRYVVISGRYQLNPEWKGYESRDVNELKKEKDRIKKHLLRIKREKDQ